MPASIATAPDDTSQPNPLAPVVVYAPDELMPWAIDIAAAVHDNRLDTLQILDPGTYRIVRTAEGAIISILPGGTP